MLKNLRKIFLLKITYALFFAVSGYLSIISSPEILNIDIFYKIGQIMGVWSLSGLALQFALSSRSKLLEQGIGLDRMTRWHSLNAKLTTLFALLHPVLLFIKPISSGTSISQIISSFGIFHYMGSAGLLLILFTVVFAIYSERLKIKYETWKVIHYTAYITILLGFAHSLYIGSDILSRGPLYYWWLFLALLTVAAVINRYIVRPVENKSSIYEVEKVKAETHNVNTVYLKPVEGKKKVNAPGQFAFIKFITGKLPKESHPFTISSSPTEEFHTHSIKESGDFTSQIKNLKPGDKAYIEGPYGVFTNFNMAGPFVFIAGGIGITPIRSMLRYMYDTSKKAKSVLIYANRTTADIAFKDELEKFAAEDWLHICHVLSQENKEGIHSGHVSEEIIRQETGGIDTKNAKFFICGPPAMMDEVKKILFNMGIDAKNIFTEEFSLK